MMSGDDYTFAKPPGGQPGCVMSKRILFVDDEPMVLKGLERSLRGMRKEWEMEFVLGGHEALEAMTRAPFDVVISDMRMPGMDGAQLLDLVKERFPQTVRIVLSGQSDKDGVFRAIRTTHQYLSKPCDIEELKHKLRCALALRDVLGSPELQQKVSQVETVPSLPSLQRALRTQLESPHPSLQDITDIVSRDPGITAKVLQLVNSSFLGEASCLSSPQQAISIIGIDNLRSLVLSVGLVSELPQALADMLALLWRHTYCTARFAKAIARCEQASETMVQDCFTAGLLHEIGWMVLASAFADQFKSLCSSLDKGIPSVDSEQAAFGGTHGQVGAYLLGLWGLPDSVIEAVAWHHAPGEIHPTSFCPLLAVHVADGCDRQLHLSSSMSMPEDDAIDEGLLVQLGLQDRLPVWQKRCQEIDEKDEK
jgi:HD-like signal output (HDOD) protein/ActR/RegA family two-component response regulator